MQFEVKIPEGKATEEVERLMDLKKIFPKRREKLAAARDTLVEAISLGYVSIDEKGAITQTLTTAVDGKAELVYKDRIDPYTMNTELDRAKATTQAAVNIAYIKAYAGCMEATVKRLESADREIADAIAFFLQ